MTDGPHYLFGRKAALAGLGIGVFLVVLLLGLPFVATYSAQKAEINDNLQQLARFRAEQKLRPALEARLKALKSRGATSPGYVTAESAALAQSAIERDIRGMAEANKAEIRSTQAGQTDKVGILEAVSVQYDMTVPMTHLKPLLYALETHTPYLFIDQIDIAAPVAWQASTSSTEPTLQLHMTVHAYRWGHK